MIQRRKREESVDSRHTEAQMIGALKQAEVGMPVAELAGKWESASRRCIGGKKQSFPIMLKDRATPV
jgi:hypothetical protein